MKKKIFVEVELNSVIVWPKMDGTTIERSYVEKSKVSGFWDGAMYPDSFIIEGLEEDYEISFLQITNQPKLVFLLNLAKLAKAERIKEKTWYTNGYEIEKLVAQKTARIYEDLLNQYIDTFDMKER